MVLILRRKWLLWPLLISTLVFIAIWISGSLLIQPVMRPIGSSPSNLPAQSVVIRDVAGYPIHGWFVPGIEHNGGVLLLHGVRTNRLSMIDRARFLHDAGYAVLLVDFQASGESPGEAITFGYREADDVKAALRYLHLRLPGERIGIIGTSMGGAAILLAEPDVDADAVVLEQVYPTIQQALRNRMRIHLGVMGAWLSPVMLATLHAHLGIYPEQLRPIDHIGGLAMPKLLIVGERDRHTTLAESLSLFDAAKTPKALWIVHGAEHVDLCRYAGDAYKARVLHFLDAHLHKPPSSMQPFAGNL